VTNVMILVNIIFVEKMATYTNKPKKKLVRQSKTGLPDFLSYTKCP
jgi:hypothetical protein